MAKIKVQTSMVFERHEKKYLISEETCEVLLQKLEDYMRRDRYGQHTICSLYLDTDDFLLVQRSMSKPQYKEKLRMRCYGLPSPESIVYLELKKKLKGVTYKRRIALPFEEAERYLALGRQPSQQGQILQEIDYFMGQYHPSPKIMLFYERIAMYGIEDENLRLTIDSNIRWRAHDLSFSGGDGGEALLPENMRLMEIKMTNAFPLWFSRLLSELKIYPVSYSKYANAYKRLKEGENASC